MKLFNKTFTPHLASAALQLTLIAAAFLAFFDPSILNPQNIGWISEGDLRQHYLGWTAFRHADTVGTPWGNAPLMAYPHGTPLSATDSNPLVSLLLWPLSELLPERFQFIGPWYLLSLALSFLIARSLFRRIGFDRFTAALLGAFLAFQPILFWRYGHDTLTAQWLILAVIHVSFLTRSLPIAVLQHAGLLVLSIMIHPYLFIMLNFVVGFDMLARAYRQFGPRFGVIELTVLCFVTGQVIALYVGSKLGIFSLQTLSPNLVGVYSTDLLSIFNPFSTSQIVPPLPAGRGQYEGYAYLGIGFVLVFGFAVYLALRKRAAPLDYRLFLPLGLAALVAFAFALSPVVTVLGSPIFEADLSDTSPIRTVFEKLRSSGRFVWITVYTLVFATLYTLPRNRAWEVRAVLVVALVLQFLDLSPLRERTQSKTAYRDVPTHELQSQDWAEKIERADYIYLSRPLGLEFSMDVGAAAFPLKTPISFFYTAQGLGMPKQQAAEDQLRVRVLSGNFDQNALALLDSEFEMPIVHRNASGIVATRDYDEFHALETQAYLGQEPLSQEDIGLVDLVRTCATGCTAALATQGDAFANLSSEFRQFITAADGNLPDEANSKAYTAIFRDGRLIEDSNSNGAEALLNASIAGRSYSLKASSSRNSSAMISIEGVDYARNQEGMNLFLTWDDGRRLSAVYNTAEVSDSLIPDSAVETLNVEADVAGITEPDLEISVFDVAAAYPVSSAVPFVGLKRYLTEESSLLDVLTDCRQACAMAISVKDEGAASMPKRVRQMAAQIGLTLSELEFRDGYSAIVENGIVLVQGRSHQEIIDVSELVGGSRVRVQSAGYAAGNISSIKINNEEHSMSRRGVNIVVILEGERVISYHFDTHGS